MENKNKTSLLSLEDQKTELLPTSFEGPRNPSPRPRSIAPSVRSDITTVDTHSSIPVLDTQAIRRRRTQIAEVKISRWQCFLGFLFGPRITERAAVATIKPPDMEEKDGEDIFDRNDCPWIQTVHVLPSENAGTKVHLQARCMFDTGCMQGNLVSKEFAFELGYKESDFKPLSPRERNGGTSATGHSHMPLGILHLTWYHNTSPRLYRDMRFLVSPNQECHLVIGSRSILLHKLVSRPNFSVTTVVTTSGSSERQKEIDDLNTAAAELKNDLQTLERKRDSAKDIQRIEKLDARIKQKTSQLAIKRAEHELCVAKKHLDEDPKSKSKQAWVKAADDDLRKAKGETAKDDNSHAQQNVPDVKIPVVKISGPDRTSTGFSSRSLIRRNQHRNREQE